MKTTNTKIGGPYDEYYASRYNKIWGESATWESEAKFHIETISSLLKNANNWLDAGCGTGFLLSKFPGVSRAGFDLSTAMLSEAKKVNHDVEFFNQNLLDAKPGWNNKWDLVTCTGQPWSYLPTLEDIEKAVKNLSAFTSMKGKLMLTPIDISDFIGIHTANFFDEDAIKNEVPVITAIHWSYKELDTIDHNCLSPNLDQWVRWFSKYFHKVEILYWPHEPSFLIIPRRVIVCGEKKSEGDESPAIIIEHPMPAAKNNNASPLSFVQSKMLFAELSSRVFSGRIIKGLAKKIFSKRN